MNIRDGKRKLIRRLEIAFSVVFELVLIAVSVVFESSIPWLCVFDFRVPWPYCHGSTFTVPGCETPRSGAYKFLKGPDRITALRPRCASESALCSIM